MATIRSEPLHADEVLDGPGDAHGHVQPGRDRLSGLADLPLVGQKARLDDRPGTGDCAAEDVREPLQHRHRFRVACPFSGYDKGWESGDIDLAVRRVFDELDHGRQVARRRIERVMVYVPFSFRVFFRQAEDLGPDGAHLRPVPLAEYSRHDIAAEGRARHQQDAFFLIDVEAGAVRRQPVSRMVATTPDRSRPARVAPISSISGLTAAQRSLSALP